MPEEYYGERVLAVIPVYTGEIDNGEDLVAPLWELGDPIADTVEPRLFVDWQQAFDDSYPPGERYYWNVRMLRANRSYYFAGRTEGFERKVGPNNAVSCREDSVRE